VGFAIPINMARGVMENLIDHGRVVRGYLGVRIQNLTPDLAKAFDLKDANGAVVADVVAGTAADEAGLRNGDVITRFAGKPIRDNHQLVMAVTQVPPGEEVTLEYIREGERREAMVTLQEMPDSGLAVLGEDSPRSADDSEVLRGVVVADLDQRARSELQAPESLSGAVVTEVDPGSAAYAAGLRPGDVIREINRQGVESAADAVRLTEKVPDKTVLLRVWNAQGTRYVVVEESQNG
jgi:serine protease Do